MKNLKLIFTALLLAAFGIWYGCQEDEGDTKADEFEEVSFVLSDVDLKSGWIKKGTPKNLFGYSLKRLGSIIVTVSPVGSDEEIEYTLGVNLKTNRYTSESMRLKRGDYEIVKFQGYDKDGKPYVAIPSADCCCGQWIPEPLPIKFSLKKLKELKMMLKMLCWVNWDGLDCDEFDWDDWCGFGCGCDDKEICDNGIDDDGDNLVDCDDPDCDGDPNCEPTEEICDNGIDDDGDNLVDCDDPDCDGDPNCEPAEEICDNGIDDDGDNLVDCDDPDCDGDPNCEPAEEICDNGIDDDGDNLVDCDDPDCDGDPNCEPAGDCLDCPGLNNTISIDQEWIDPNYAFNSNNCGYSATLCVTYNSTDDDYDVEIKVTVPDESGGCGLSHLTIEVPNDDYSDVTIDTDYEEYEDGYGNNDIDNAGFNGPDPDDSTGFKYEFEDDDVVQGDVITITFTIPNLQVIKLLAKSGNNYDVAILDLTECNGND